MESRCMAGSAWFGRCKDVASQVLRTRWTAVVCELGRPLQMNAMASRVDGCGLLPVACFLFYSGARLVAPLLVSGADDAPWWLQFRFTLSADSNQKAGASGQLNWRRDELGAKGAGDSDSARTA